ncbi:hypothetical protein [Bradyrhizobium sp. RD5-C2]|uniref:hypothetical protein n=1 Tax=Bradyrhizobium sp. RD5-C2 TaxID=244562 RepID=UPI001CC67379|nr:hypothetical protein [Bradyrhizobium sp. RD5-C2]GIQ77832.1 hypothetical protein BraRD5C2_62820 [Bradyrhizobium sp. RD5-C2]
MAKDPDNLAADFDAESSTGFLAEEDALDRRMLWRLGSWGVAAVGAVTIAVMANQSALTLRRDQVAASDVARQAQQLQTLAKESHNETRRLASAIDTLNGDRDRLYSRVTTLEQGLDSVTGTIAKQPVAAVPAPTSSAAAPATPPASANSAPAVAAPAVAAVATTPPAAVDKLVATDKMVASIDSKAPAPAPVEKPVATTEKPMAADKKPTATTSRPLVATEKPSAPESSPPVSAAAPSVASPMSAAAAAANTDEIKPAAPAAAATPVDKPLMASRDPAPNRATEAAKPPTASDVSAAPIPPLVITPDPDSEVEEDAPKAQVQRTEFGVDLGTANSVNGLRALWRGLLKSKANAPLAALRPIIVIKENSNGLGMQLRLVAGPLNDAGTAAKICAGLSLVQRTCETAIYDGQRLALNEPPAGAKPALPHRRVAPRRTAAPPPQPVAEEKKPEPTTISSMFRRNSQ